MNIAIRVCLAVLLGDSAEPMITNCRNPNDSRPRLPVQSVLLYEPAHDWTYSHHPSITFFKGRFYAMWSNGREDEDAPGQRVLYCASEDFAHWTTPKPLVGPLMGVTTERVLTAAGWHQHEGTLVAYVGQYEYAAEQLVDGKRPKVDAGHRNTRLLAMKTTDGEHWSGILDLGIPIVPNHPPQATRSGRLILCGNISFPYTDDPSGLGGWIMTGIYPPDMAGRVFDDSEGFQRVQERQGWPVGLCEGSFYQTDDGVLHMLLRSGTPRLWVTTSRDNGATWSAPQAAEFTDNVAKFHFGRLPDQRFYYVGNPDPEPRWQRNPLVLSLSADGARFDKHFILADAPRTLNRAGLHKGGVYGYPHTMAHDGSLYVIVSIGKESVMALRVALASR